jgi:hypothetical protein
VSWLDLAADGVNKATAMERVGMLVSLLAPAAAGPR